ncbi:MAG: hypothetical protein PVF85_07990 [Anaerolineales bacterium]|jgi:hypothetical protein
MVEGKQSIRFKKAFRGYCKAEIRKDEMEKQPTLPGFRDSKEYVPHQQIRTQLYRLFEPEQGTGPTRKA